jgi:hypothetical protein
VSVALAVLAATTGVSLFAVMVTVSVVGTLPAPKGRKVRERALDYRERLVEKMGLSAADFQNLREELVRLRTNLSDSEIGKP